MSQHYVLSIRMVVQDYFGSANMKGYVHARDVMTDTFAVILQIETIKIESLLLFVIYLLLLCHVFFTNFFGHFAYIRVLHTLNKAFRLVGWVVFRIRNSTVCRLQTFGRLAYWVLLLYLTQIQLTNSFKALPFRIRLILLGILGYLLHVIIPALSTGVVL